MLNCVTPIIICGRKMINVTMGVLPNFKSGSMKNTARYTISILCLAAAAICIAGGFQQYTSSSSFFTVAEVLFVSALLLLIVSLGLLLKRTWVTPLWGSMLLSFAVVSIQIYIVPMLHSGAGISLERLAWLLPSLIVPLLAGLVLLKFLPSIVESEQKPALRK